MGGAVGPGVSVPGPGRGACAEGNLCRVEAFADAGACGQGS